MAAPALLRGDRLRAKRLELGYTQQDLADTAGVTDGYISQLEHERSVQVTLPVAVALATRLRVSVDWLCGRTEKETLDPDVVGTHGICGWHPVPCVPVLLPGEGHR